MKKILLLLSIFAFIYAKEVRIVALDPASIEIIYMLGGEKNLKAIAKLKYSKIYPYDKTELLENVGTFSNPSIERIMSFKPDIVILSSYSLNLKEQLENLKVKTFLFEANRFADIENNIYKIGKLLNKDKEAKILVEKFKNDLSKLRENPLNKTVTFLYSSQPLMAFGNVYLTQDIMDLLGLKNIAPTHMPRPILSQEYMLETDPDLIIYGMQIKSMETLMYNNAFLEKTKAFKNDMLFSYPDTHELLRGSPTIINKIQELKDMLHNRIDKK